MKNYKFFEKLEFYSNSFNFYVKRVPARSKHKKVKKKFRLSPNRVKRTVGEIEARGGSDLILNYIVEENMYDFVSCPQVD